MVQEDRKVESGWRKEVGTPDAKKYEHGGQR